ncbi:DUF1643 domain-containing protein [Methylobacterium fujisawaense]|uniref:DUF1643 domain-containing protein n=1 Tax=Methylobacterium fujisawaense TaxID=107400 RepID=UPI002F35ACDE
MRLDRWWSDEPRALICGANPSKAGAEKHDPTVWRIVELLHGRPGIGGFTLVNVETYIATDPADLVRWCDRQDLDVLQHVRRTNLARIRALSAEAAVRIVAWGALAAPGLHTNRIIAALSLDGTHALHAFELTGEGAPKHPLARGRHRIAGGQPLIVWRAAEKQEVR